MCVNSSIIRSHMYIINCIYIYTLNVYLSSEKVKDLNEEFIIGIKLYAQLKSEITTQSDFGLLIKLLNHRIRIH